MNTTKNNTRQLTVYWDAQDPDNEGWYSKLTTRDMFGNFATTEEAIAAERDDLDGAIDEACRFWEIDATHDDFATSDSDGGSGVWTEATEETA